MWFSPHENHARDPQLLFYLAATARPAPAADLHLRVPGRRLFREKASWCAPARDGGARWRPKSPEVAPETPKVVKGESKNRNGCPWGAFWETFCHFLGDCGVWLDATHSQAKTYIFRFGRSQVGTSSSTFPGMDFRVSFYAFLCGCISFLAPPALKSNAEGVPRVPNVSPNARKSLPGDLQKSMKIRLCGLRGCPGSPGRSRGTPPARKVS